MFRFFEFVLIKLSISILNLLFFKFVLICKPQAAFFPLIKLKPNQQTKMTQRISINFNLNRKKANQTTQEFLLGIFNPSEEDTEQKDNLQKALEGTSLKVKEANLLIQQLLTAITIDENDSEGW